MTLDKQRTAAKPKLTATASPWRPISQFKDKGGIPRRVDVWLNIHASPRSMGMADAFRVADAYRRDGKWYHPDGGEQKELYADYITHFMERPAGPDGSVHY